MNGSGTSDTPTALLFSTRRTFRALRYGVGHTRLLLGSSPDEEHTDHLVLHFVGVHAMQLVTRSYRALEVHAVVEPELSTIHELSGMPTRWRAHNLIVKLRSDSGTGWVLCGRVTLERAEGGPGHEFGLPELRDVIWSLRPSDLRQGGSVRLEGGWGTP
ncbi:MULTISPECIES: hypothetical protein [unclassified Streptomyces]|uniref:hypothetical protein n=1 Tax=unclassified Streptomyces TaxID=2593676 RepID=UPI002E2D18A0|nr:hypothetical protein [Streptomyces sp. NBC_01423]WSX89219.1 hypothetical protein OH827_01085 [Streptomyces sp. NBC_00891]WSY03698.1 hypothetical protein OG464_01085 [Streptomyces sp. NBC_00890]WSZ05324.1 hypothetical protein OG704_01085 [Streptomyces sp. NBC_00869]WSZ27180.1 hypothetical protein OG498_32480 [Streptomyces sp. NBC_00870]